MRILVVEDNAAIRAIVCRVLSDAGRLAVATDSGREAGELLASEDFDAVVADLLLADAETGLDVARAASALGIRCVIMSGATESLVQAEAQGCRFLAKPFRKSELLEAVAWAERDHAPNADLHAR